MSEELIPFNETIAAELMIARRSSAGKFRCSGICKSIEVDPVLRAITCTKCGFTIDPFEYIDQWAREGERRMQVLHRLDHEIKCAHAELDSLDRRLDSVRAKLKRGGEPQPADERQDFRTRRINPPQFGQPLRAV